VVLSGLLLAATGWYWLDPATSLAVVLVIMASTMGLLMDAGRLALQAVPAGIDPAAVRAALHRMPGVIDSHDLHIWPLSTTETALTAHLVVPGSPPGDEFHVTISHMLEHEFGIHHSTIQVERGSPAHPCKLAPDDTV
jgi:cobalt-zinc-cadmium efflux system protein